jgi:hypothetical protein
MAAGIGGTNPQDNRMKNRFSIISWLVLILAVFFLGNGVVMFFAPHAWFFELVPGVPETGSFNAHLVQDGGTFNLAIGVGLLMTFADPMRHLSAVVIAAVASLMHSALHIYSHEAGLLSLKYIGTEIGGIYVPTLVLIAIAIYLLRAPRSAVSPARSAA